MREPVLVGIPSSAYAERVGQRLAEAECATVTDVPALIARRLRMRELAAALLAPTDYGRDSSAYQIIPGAAVSAAGPYGLVRLCFRPHSRTRTITHLAADPSSSAEIILARILLAEEYDSAPVIVPHTGPLSAMLETAEAALVVGKAPQAPQEIPGDSLDLVEAWQELTELPYVYGIWCAYERVLPRADGRRIQTAHRQVQADMERLREESGVAFRPLFQYSGQALLEESMRELFHYAYYHGILPDVPELEYFSVDSAEESPD